MICLSGCAHSLRGRQDAKIRQKCGADGALVHVPMPVWHNRGGNEEQKQTQASRMPIPGSCVGHTRGRREGLALPQSLSAE